MDHKIVYLCVLLPWLNTTWIVTYGLQNSVPSCIAAPTQYHLVFASRNQIYISHDQALQSATPVNKEGFILHCNRAVLSIYRLCIYCSSTQLIAPQVKMNTIPQCGTWCRDGNRRTATYSNAGAVEYEQTLMNSMVAKYITQFYLNMSVSQGATDHGKATPKGTLFWASWGAVNMTEY